MVMMLSDVQHAVFKVRVYETTSSSDFIRRAFVHTRSINSSSTKNFLVVVVGRVHRPLWNVYVNRVPSNNVARFSL